MKLIKKLIDWFEDLLWKLAIEDVFEKPEYYFDIEDLPQPKLSNAINLKEKFKTERSLQKENSWAKIRILIENAMKEGKGYVAINSDTYKSIPLRELSHEIKKAKYKLRDNTCGLAVKYCYNMGYSLIICWE